MDPRGRPRSKNDTDSRRPWLDDAQAFQGNVIKGSHKNGSQILPGKSFTVRRIASGVGVERTLPISSPSIDSLKVVRRGKVKQSNLYYLRDLTGKKARIKEAR